MTGSDKRGVREKRGKGKVQGDPSRSVRQSVTD